MEYTSSPKPQLSSRANAFSIAALMSSGKPSKEKEAEENTIKPLGKRWRKRGVKIEKLITEIIKVSRCVEITAVKSWFFYAELHKENEGFKEGGDTAERKIHPS